MLVFGIAGNRFVSTTFGCQLALQITHNMLRRAASLLPSSLRAISQAAGPSVQRGYADLNLSDPQILKKFMGVEEHLGGFPDSRSTLSGMLNELLEALKQLPDSSDYRRAVEATVQYRLKVLEQNDSNLAVEEVLDAHMEELILETKEELGLVPLMTGKQQGRELWAWGETCSSSNSSAVRSNHTIAGFGVVASSLALLAPLQPACVASTDSNGNDALLRCSVELVLHTWQPSKR
jgi:NADH dehydrogenase (ubiquinone) 1 alpha subcomplex subunit 5